MNDDDLLTYRYPRTRAQAWPWDADLSLHEEEDDAEDAWADVFGVIFAALAVLGWVCCAFFFLGYFWYRSAP